MTITAPASTTNALRPCPATVREIVGGKVQLQMLDQTVWARLALATPYRPAIGDVVLAFGDVDDQVFVIGVLTRTGNVVIEADGDIELRARGVVRIHGEEEVELESPKVTIRADKLETFARVVFERFVDAYRWVRGLDQRRLGRLRTVVEGQATLRAERIVERARKDVSIDGEKIRLG